MTNKDVAAKYGVPKNTLLAVGATTKQIKQFSTGLLKKEAKKFQLMGSYLKKKLQNLRKH